MPLVSIITPSWNVAPLIGEAILGPENEETVLKESMIPMIALALVLLGTLTRRGFVTMVEYTAPVFWLFFLLTGVFAVVIGNLFVANPGAVIPIVLRSHSPSTQSSGRVTWSRRWIADSCSVGSTAPAIARSRGTRDSGSPLGTWSTRYGCVTSPGAAGRPRTACRVSR